MKSEIRFKKTAVFLLALTLICTVLAIFLPYGIEPLLGIAAVCIAIHTVYLAHEKFIDPFWLSLVAVAVSVNDAVVMNLVIHVVILLQIQMKIDKDISSSNLNCVNNRSSN